MEFHGLAGKRVAITAAASGIGYIIAKRLNESGCRVAICDVNHDALQSAAVNLHEVLTSVADVSDATQVQKFFSQIKTLYGGLDALINNAGTAGPTASVEDIKLQEWQQCLDVGLTGHFLCTRTALPLIKSSGGGSIINMSSVVGKLGFALRSPYSAVKFGVIGLTQCWAKELGPQNIRVNALLPGIVKGRRIQEVIDARAKALSITSEEMENSLLSSVSMRRMVTADDVAGMSAFLISDLGQNISGQSIAIDANVETI